MRGEGEIESKDKGAAGEGVEEASEVLGVVNVIGTTSFGAVSTGNEGGTRGEATGIGGTTGGNTACMASAASFSGHPVLRSAAFTASGLTPFASCAFTYESN